MAIIDDCYIGKTHIIVRDNYRCKPEEIPIILDRMSKIASRALYAEALKKELIKLKEETA